MGVRVNVYIDAFNVYYGCLKDSPYKWLDLELLSKHYLKRDDQLNRIRYFTAQVKSRPDDPRAPQRQQIYLRALQTIPCLTVHFGRFQENNVRMRLANPPAKGASTAMVVKTEEKGSDVNLATFLLLDAFRKDAELAIVVSNDSDLVEPIRIAQQELGLPVGILNPHRNRSIGLERIPPAFFKQIREGALRASQFPATMQDERGTLTRPASWDPAPETLKPARGGLRSQPPKQLGV